MYSHMQGKEGRLEYVAGCKGSALARAVPERTINCLKSCNADWNIERLIQKN